MHKFYHTLLLVFAVLLWSTLVVQGQFSTYLQVWEAGDGVVEKGIVFDQGHGLKYDLYIHNSIPKGTPVPLFVFIHGGAWSTGARGDISYACKLYGKQGCITATMDHQLSSTEHPEIILQTMLDDITHCLEHLKGKLAQEGYVVPKVALSGYSSGGHLAMLYAYKNCQESPIPIAFVFHKVGPSTFKKGAFKPEHLVEILSRSQRVSITKEELDSPTVQEYTKAMSPAELVTKDTVPTIFAYGGRDNIVNQLHRDALLEALQTNKVPFVCVDFKNSDHGMYNDPRMNAKFTQAVMRYAQKYMGLVPPQNSTDAPQETK